MTNLVILPILIPLFISIILIFFPKNIPWQRGVSLAGSIMTMIAAILLTYQVYSNGIQTMDLSGWEAPFGITLVSDMLSAILVLTTSIIGLACLVYSFSTIGEAREKFYYYPIFSFLIVGVNGAFSTGDIFNLFVFFEVMLMSSYVLLVLGGSRIQLRESIKYILVNIISSALFVIAVAYLYSVVGTLNMAHISERISEIGQPGILTVIGVLFLIVFGLKGGIFPLYVWMPGSYSAPPSAVLALFGALLTKVGVYSILRTYSLFFSHDGGFTSSLLQVLALLTLAGGAIGAFGYSDLKKIIIYNIIAAVGLILFGVSIGTGAGYEGALFYLVHDMIIKAALFLQIGLMIKITGTSDLGKIRGLIHKYPFLGWSFFIAALALAGIPPLSGFPGKAMIVGAGFAEGHYIGSALVLFTSLLVLYSVMKIFIRGFWGEEKDYSGSKPPVWLYTAPALLTALAVLYGVGAEPVYQLISKAAGPLADPSVYINAVLKGE
ncbi:Na+/H+ antiporter subunit D [Peribacillus sp. SCS-37]|uniref:Na+/H+ antiporter subunit D n=1 Tax=Paraperibacillus esterisolvens TaxID=3115296 RepID=UPI003905F579